MPLTNLYLDFALTSALCCALPQRAKVFCLGTPAYRATPARRSLFVINKNWPGYPGKPRRATPARSFGLLVINKNWPGYPGKLVSANLYSLLGFMHYESDLH
jgi:hypothetical protein